MRGRRRPFRPIACLVAAACLAAAAPARPAHAQARWHGEYFPNVALQTQNGEWVHFYDLIKGRKVLIELIYTSCTFACPLETARLAQVQALLGDRVGRDFFFYSISIDPEHDTPPVLKAFAEKYHAGPGWTFLTGSAPDIDRLSRKLGLYSDPDPSNQDGHTPLLLLGNEATGQWTRVSALDNPKLTATMISNWFGGYTAAAPQRTYADARPVANLDGGEYLFRTRCAACHTIGGGPAVGPDLSGVTTRRDPRWLAEYIAHPDRALAQQDPIAKGLFAQFKEVPMPNLELSDEQIRALVAYLARSGSAARK